MKHLRPIHNLCAGTLAIGIIIAGCGGSGSSSGGGTTTTTGGGVTLMPGFAEAKLISDQAGVAALTDPNMVNPWGIAYAPGGAWWLADNNSNFATVYSGGGAGGTITNVGLNVQIPFGNPTGQVYNPTTDFQITSGSTTAPAVFIFSSETGWIDAWSGGTSAVAEAVVSGAVYKGLAIGSNATGNFLYATNFSNGTVDVFDKNFAQATLSGTFTDPNMPAGFAPFGIQNFGGTLYVSYAKQDAAKHDDQKGAGNGYIDTFDTNGNLLGRLVSQGNLNSPWGLVMTPSSFGAAGNMLLVGNFGDGKINVYNPSGGAYVGTLASSATQAIVIPGLWGLMFGNGGSAGDTTSLYFSSGPSSEAHGLFGKLTTPPPPKQALKR